MPNKDYDNFVARMGSFDDNFDDIFEGIDLNSHIKGVSHMDDNQRALSHFGVPGMKWGVRRAAKYDIKIRKANAKAQKQDSKGNKEAANRARDAADIYKQRKANVKEIARMGEQVRKGTTLVDKLLGTDVNLMSMKLAKGKYTSGELAVSNILQGRRAKMRTLVSQKIVEKRN